MKQPFVLMPAFFLLMATVLLPVLAIADEADPREVTVSCDAPATNYSIEIESVWHVGKELWVVSKISKHGDFGGAAITPLSDSVEVDADDDLEIKHYISGKTWNWWKGVEAEFIDSRDALLEQMEKDKTEIDEVLYGDDPAEEA